MEGNNLDFFVRKANPNEIVAQEPASSMVFKVILEEIDLINLMHYRFVGQLNLDEKGDVTKSKRGDTMVEDDKLNDVLELAQHAFWRVVADSYPDITTGDFPPDCQDSFTEACQTAVWWWLHYNEGDK